MTPELTTAALDELEKAEKAMTPGPWTAGGDWLATAEEMEHGIGNGWLLNLNSTTSTASGFDLDAIAKLRNAAPALIAAARLALTQAEEIARLTAENNAVCTALKEIEAGGSTAITIGAYCERMGDKPIELHPEQVTGLLMSVVQRLPELMPFAHAAVTAQERNAGLQASLAAQAEEIARTMRTWCALEGETLFDFVRRLREDIAAAQRQRDELNEERVAQAAEIWRLKRERSLWAAEDTRRLQATIAAQAQRIRLLEAVAEAARAVEARGMGTGGMETAKAHRDLQVTLTALDTGKEAGK